MNTVFHLTKTLPPLNIILVVIPVLQPLILLNSADFVVGGHSEFPANISPYIYGTHTHNTTY